MKRLCICLVHFVHVLYLFGNLDSRSFLKSGNVTVLTTVEISFQPSDNMKRITSEGLRNFIPSTVRLWKRMSEIQSGKNSLNTDLNNLQVIFKDRDVWNINVLHTNSDIASNLTLAGKT